MNKRELVNFVNSIKTVRNGAEDELALDSKYIYPLWKTETVYSVDERVLYSDHLYRCVQSHTSQDNWTPDAVPALWTEVWIEEWPEWVQPIGAQDAYHIGDKVSHNGSHWISNVDNNIWEPGIYGWSNM